MSKLEAIAKKIEEAGAMLPDIDFDKYLKDHESDNSKLKCVVDYFDELDAWVDRTDFIEGDMMPFNKIKNLFRFREGEVTLWTGFNSHKKSMFVGFIILDLLKQGKKSCIASFEMRPVNTIVRMTRQYSNVDNVTGSEIGDFMGFAARNFYILDQLGGMSPQRLYGVITYAVRELGVKHFVIDSLMRVVAGEDKYNEQKDFVVKLCEIAMNLKCHIHLIHHVRDGDESKPSNRYSAKGSKAISDNVHNSLIVWSNKDKNPDMPDVILKCDKQREGEWEGMMALNFDSHSLNFSEKF